MQIRAIYKDGVFKPLEDVPVKEGTEVDVYPREQP
jgi:predicted DNA-binding antitoxin AbrB/MazE fold protein